MNNINKIKEYIRNNVIIFVILAVLLMILVNTLLINPIMGKVDNGDFGKVKNFSGILDIGKSYEDIYDGTFHNKYIVNILYFLIPWSNDWIIGVVIAKLSVLLFLPLKLSGIVFYDIRFLSIIYISIYMLSFYWILSYKKFNNLTKCLIGILSILLLTDVNYILYFNSFFGEASSIVFLLLMIGSFLHLLDSEKVSKKRVVVFFVASICFLLSKTQNIPLLIFMLLIYIAIYFYTKEKKVRKYVVILSMISIISCSIVYMSIGKYTNRNNLYQAVFTGVLKDSQDPVRDLQFLNLPIKYASLAGSGFYDKNLQFDPLGADMLGNFYPNVSNIKVLKYYLTHPNRLWEKVVHSAATAYEFHNVSKVNFVKGEYTENKLYNGFRTYLISEFPSLHTNIWIFLIFTSSVFVFCSYNWVKYKDRDTRLLVLLVLFILATGSSQFVLPVIGSGEADFGKHLFLISISYDILFIISIIYIVHKLKLKR